MPAKKSWSCQLCSVGFHSALTFFLANCFFFFFKATTPILGWFPINKEYFFIYLKLSLLLRCWECMSLARACTLWVLTLNSIHCNLCHFCIGQHTDQWLLYINPILNFENHLFFFFPPLVNLWYRSSS